MDLTDTNHNIIIIIIIINIIGIFSEAKITRNQELQQEYSREHAS